MPMIDFTDEDIVAAARDDDGYFPGDDDPTKNQALICAIGRLVVRSAELEEMIAFSIGKLGDKEASPLHSLGI